MMLMEILNKILYYIKLKFFYSSFKNIHEIKLRAMHNMRYFSNYFLPYKRKWLSISLPFLTFMIGIRLDFITLARFHYTSLISLAALV